MKTTVTEEFEDGQLVRRTTVTDDAGYATGGLVPNVSPWTIGDAPAGCYCGQPWNSILPPPPCPVHKPSWPGASITVGVNSSATPAEIAEKVGVELRRIA